MIKSLLRILAVLAFILPLCAYAWLQHPAAFDHKIHIRYMAWGNPEQAAADAHLLARFEELHPNIKVDNTVVSWDFYHQKLQIMLASGTAPDVFKMDIYFVPKYFPYGYFKPVDEMAAGDPDFHLADFHPVSLEEMQYKGHVLGLNTLFGGKIIYYNKNLLKNAGLKDPWQMYQEDLAHKDDPAYARQWTFETFMDYAKKLTLRGPDGLTQQFGVVVDTTDLWWIIWGFGGDIVTKTGDVKVDQPEAIAGLNYYNDLVNIYHVAPRANENSGGNFKFENGHVGMMTNWAGVTARARKDANFDWDIVPLPFGPKGSATILKGNGFIVAANSPHPKEAWELLKFLTSPEAELAYCGPQLRRAIPTRTAVAQSPEFTGVGDGRPPLNTATFQALYDRGRDIPATSYWFDWQVPFKKWTDRMLLKGITPEGITPEEAARNLAADIRKIVSDSARESHMEGKPE